MMNDNHLQQLLLQTEVTPPQNRWEMIVVALDEMAADQPLQQQLLSAEIPVPQNAWMVIEEKLDDQFYLDQVEHATAPVPIQLWEAINIQLDEIKDEEIAAKLIAIRENPPATIWNAIEEQLSQNQPAKVIPFKRSYKPIYRLAAAAIITGILALSGYWLLNRDNQTVAVVTTEHPALPEQKELVPLQNEPEPEPQQESTTVATNSRTNVKNRIQQELNLNNVVAYAEPDDHSSQTAVTANDIHHQSSQPAPATTSFAENKYFVVLNESGDLVRVSKKISNLKCLNSSFAAPVDAAMVLQAKDCNEQIKLWQQKMAMSATLSASGGYIDLSEIINNTDQ